MFADNDAIAMIAVKDLARARKFYEGVLGLKPSSPSDSEVQSYVAGNTPIAVYVSQFAGSNKATAISWQVENVEQAVQSLKTKGVTFEHYDLPETTRRGDIHEAGEMQLAWFKDPDGNIIGLMTGQPSGQREPTGQLTGRSGPH